MGGYRGTFAVERACLPSCSSRSFAVVFVMVSYGFVLHAATHTVAREQRYFVTELAGIESALRVALALALLCRAVLFCVSYSYL